jgi:thiosulfate/3-mercaptopyruvate sulfurtransferase
MSALGHEKVSILDGGLPRWVAEGCETETSDTPDFAESQYTTVKEQSVDKEAVRSYEQIVANAEKAPGDEGAEIVLEHRALARCVSINTLT